MDQDRETPETEDAEVRQQARREVLAKLGIYGAVSAPLMMSVLKADNAVAQSVGIPGDCDPGDPGSCF